MGCCVKSLSGHEIFLQIAIKVVYFRATLGRKCKLALSNSAAVWITKFIRCLFLCSMSIQLELFTGYVV